MANSRIADDQLSEWIRRGAEGEEQACAALYHSLSPQVFRLAVGLLGNVADAEEVVQDTFVYALRNLKRFDPARSAVGAWLYTIALGRCRNKRRRRTLVTLPLEFLDGQRREGPRREIETALEQRGVRQQTWEALQTLSPRLRETLVLRFLSGLTYAEIGQVMGCNPKTAESRVRLGLAAMRRVLQTRGVEADLRVALSAW